MIVYISVGKNEYWDASLSTGLEMYDFEARFYDPQLGRWFVGDPAEQFHNPYLAMGNNPVVYVDPDGEFVFVVVGALLGAYIGGTSANGGEFNPGKWDWNSGDTWAGVLIGGGLGALGGWGAAHAGPALANTSFFSNFGLSGTTAAYTITGGVAGGAIGYSSGFAGGMLHSNGNWEYGHQAGVFGAQIGSAVGSAIGAGYGLATGFDVNMPEYEAPADVEWNKSWRASSGNSGYGMSAFNSEIGILSDAPYSIDFTNSTDIQKMEHIIRSMRTSVHLGKDYMDFRQIFHNFPLYGGSQRFGGFTTILGSRMPMHMDLGIYSDMRMDLYRVGQFRYEGHGFFKDQFELSGVWQHFRYSKFGGNIPLLSIHWQSNSQDLLFNYIYR